MTGRQLSELWRTTYMSALETHFSVHFERPVGVPWEQLDERTRRAWDALALSDEPSAETYARFTGSWVTHEGEIGEAMRVAWAAVDAAKGAAR